MRALLFRLLLVPVFAQAPIRVHANGRDWALQRFPARGVPAVVNTGVLLLAGAEAWRGAAAGLATAIAGLGYEVYGIGAAAAPSPGDLGPLAQSATRGTGRKLILAAWSEAASTAIAGAARPDTRGVFAGLMLVAARPDPAARAQLQAVGLPVAAVQSATEEAQARRIRLAAREPKKVVLVPARDGLFTGGQTLMHQAVSDSIRWIGEHSEAMRTPDR